MKYVSILICAVLALFTTEAQAKHRKHHHRADVSVTLAHPDCNILWPCEGVRPNPRGVMMSNQMKFGGPQMEYVRPKREKHSRAPRVEFNPVRTVERVVTTVAQILPHPTGCPSRAFCGCGAAQEVGKSGDRSLWLARSWYKFPRSNAAAGMAAVRTRHVFVLRQHVSGDLWLVADHNSGGHMSRLHVRSIAGYTIVNPHG